MNTFSPEQENPKFHHPPQQNHQMHDQSPHKHEEEGEGHEHEEEAVHHSHNHHP